MKLAGFLAVSLIFVTVDLSTAQSSNSFVTIGVELLKYLNIQSPFDGQMNFNSIKFISQFMLNGLEDPTSFNNTQNVIENGMFRLFRLSPSQQNMIKSVGDIIMDSLVKQYNEVKNSSDWSEISSEDKLIRVFVATLYESSDTTGQLLRMPGLVNAFANIRYNMTQIFETLEEAAGLGQEEFSTALYTVFNTTLPSNFLTKNLFTTTMIEKSIQISSQYVYRTMNLTRDVTGFTRMSDVVRATIILQNIDWISMMTDINRVVNDEIKEYFTAPPINNQCSSDLASFRASLTMKNFQSFTDNWGWKMVDAMGKPGSDILEGGFSMPGSKLECDQIRGHRVTQNKTEKWAFGTNYCISKWALPKSAVPSAALMPGRPAPKVAIGVCLPESCHSDDLVALTKFTELIGVNSSDAYCFDELPANTDAAAHDAQYILAWCILGFFITLTVVCSTIDRVHYIRLENSKLNSKDKKQDDSIDLKQTVVNGGYENGGFEKGADTPMNGNGVPHETLGVDVSTEKSDIIGMDKSVEDGRAPSDIESKSEEKPAKKKMTCGKGIVKAFSVFNNMSFLLNTTERPGSLKGLNGIRFFSICWVIIGHVYGVQNFVSPLSIRNGLTGMKWFADWQFQAITGGVYAVDSFFLLSGVLVGYLFLKMMDKVNGRLECMHMVLYYVHRYLRLTPLLAAVIVLWVGFDRYIGQGPFMNWTRAEPCDKWWWSSLLYVNNLLDEPQCHGVVWYLANDMQFYIIAPLFLIPLYKKKVVGYILLGWALIAHLAVHMWLWADIGEAGSLLGGNPQVMEKIYIKPWTRIGPYLIGLILAHILFKKYSFKNKIIHAALWLVSIGLIATLVYAPWDDMKGAEKLYGGKPRWNLAQRVAFEGSKRTVWAIALGWIIFACNTNAAGVIGDLLNWSGWAPLSKLTYSAYLFHILLQTIDIYNIAQPLYLSHYLQVKQFIVILVCSYVGGTLLHLLFEAPMAGIEKLILPSR